MVSSLVLRHDRARLRQLIPAPRHDIAKPLASCRSETQRVARSQERVSFLRFLPSKNIDRETQGYKEPAPLYIQVAIKIVASGKEADAPYDANKRAPLPKIARSAASFNQIFREIYDRKLHQINYVASHFFKFQKNINTCVSISLANLNFDKVNILFS